MERVLRSTCAALALALASGQNVTPPANQSGTPLVFAFSGTRSVDLYGPLLQAIQAKAADFNLSVWTVAADSLLDTDAGVSQVLESQPTAQVFYGGHGMQGGLGAAAAQVYATTKGNVAGVVLLAGFLQRTWRPCMAVCEGKWALQPTHECPWGSGDVLCPGGYLPGGVHDCSCLSEPMPNYPVPTLSVGGELDGVVRVARFAEAWYTQRDVPEHRVALVDGMNHGDLLAQVPEDVAAADLQSELGPDSARGQVAVLVAAFLASPGQFQPRALDTFFSPFVQMFVEQEGSWWFTGNSDESGFSNWAADAQRRMIEPLPEGFFGWQTKDSFHLLGNEHSNPPYYRPTLRPEVELLGDGHSLVGRSVTQLRYLEIPFPESHDGLSGWRIIREETSGVLSSDQFPDDGTAYVSALEIATKLASRQLGYIRMGRVAPDSLDAGSRCRDINQAAYDLALSVASDRARERFQNLGRPLTMVSDQMVSPLEEPEWIWSYLQFNDRGEDGVEVSSRSTFHSLDSPMYGAGSHSCKLLSPARALEWIYTDSLRRPPSAVAARHIAV